MSQLERVCTSRSEKFNVLTNVFLVQCSEALPSIRPLGQHGWPHAWIYWICLLLMFQVSASCIWMASVFGAWDISLAWWSARELHYYYAGRMRCQVNNCKGKLLGVWKMMNEEIDQPKLWCSLVDTEHFLINDGWGSSSVWYTGFGVLIHSHLQDLDFWSIFIYKILVHFHMQGSRLWSILIYRTWGSAPIYRARGSGSVWFIRLGVLIHSDIQGSKC